MVEEFTKTYVNKVTQFFRKNGVLGILKGS